MSDDYKTPLALTTVAAVCLLMTALFRLDLWGKPKPIVEHPPVDPAFTNTATVRMSAEELLRSDEDSSGLQCYACHEQGKPPEITFDENQQLVLPEEHEDLVMRHGRFSRNINCFNCHDPENLDKLKTRDGRVYGWEQSTLLCASCHGPTYRDWEIGIHGRTSGHWDRSKGPITKVQCASCHHPHAPEFTSLPPAPGPHRLHDNHGGHGDHGPNHDDQAEHASGSAEQAEEESEPAAVEPEDADGDSETNENGDSETEQTANTPQEKGGH